MLEAEARKRQAHGLTAPGRTLMEPVPQAIGGATRDKAGELLGVSGRYVSMAKEVRGRVPEFVPRVLSGEMTLTRGRQHGTPD